MMPLSVHGVVWLPRLLHWLCHSLVLALVGIGSSSSVESKKVFLELNCSVDVRGSNAIESIMAA